MAALPFTEEPADLTFTAAAAEAGERLDKFLAAAEEIGSRALAQRLIAEGRALVGGGRQSKNYRLQAGDRIELWLPEATVAELKPQPMQLVIPFEDEYLLVVDKPAGLVTHPAKGHSEGTLVNGLLAYQIAGGEHPHRPGIVHRLDKDTSGLLVVAKDDATHRLLVELLKRHEVSRTYLALVHGLFETTQGTVDAPVGRDSAQRQRMAISLIHGREAVTHFQVLQSWSDADAGRARSEAEGYSLLQVRLETGRTHQIRVHLAAIGHPVAGDKTYGRRRDELEIGRQFLHATRLEFSHPHTGETVAVESPLPGDLKAVLERLGQSR